MKEEIKNTKILEKTVRPKNAKTLKQVQGDMEVYGHCERMRSNPAYYFARSAEKNLSPFTSYFSQRSAFTFHFSQRFAFTLAEVLITLGIIGVVAAMTMPTLIQSYKKKVVETKLSRFYNIINNAIALSEINNGDKTTWLEPNDITDEEVTETGGKNKMDAWLIKYIVPYVKITKKEVLSDVPVLYFSDGTVLRWNGYDIYFYTNNLSCTKTARCMFLFSFAPKGGTYWGYAKDKGVEPYSFNLNIDNAEEWCKTTDKLLPGDARGNNYCTMWIKLNGWKIPDDYPWKF